MIDVSAPRLRTILLTNGRFNSYIVFSLTALSLAHEEINLSCRCRWGMVRPLNVMLWFDTCSTDRQLPSFDMFWHTLQILLLTVQSTQQFRQTHRNHLKKHIYIIFTQEFTVRFWQCIVGLVNLDFWLRRTTIFVRAEKGDAFFAMRHSVFNDCFWCVVGRPCFIDCNLLAVLGINTSRTTCAVLVSEVLGGPGRQIYMYTAILDSLACGILPSEVPLTQGLSLYSSSSPLA